MLCALCACARCVPPTQVSQDDDLASVHVNARADGASLPALTTLSRYCQCQMAAAEVSDAAELAEPAAERSARHTSAALLGKRSGGALKEFRGNNPHSVWYGLAAAAVATYVCRAAGWRALVDAGRGYC